MTSKTVAGRAPNIAIKRRSALGRLDILDVIAHAARHLGWGVAGRDHLHDYGGFASAQVGGVGRGRAGKGEVGDRASVCEGRNREPRTPFGFCPYGGGSLWIRSRSLLRVRAVGSAFRARGCTRSLLREMPGGTG